MTAASAAVLDQDGLVENLIVVDIDENRETTFELPDKEIIVLGDGARITIGWKFEAGAWIEPPPDPVEESPAVTE